MTNQLNKKENLRISNAESNRLTKECLQTALIELMAKKKIEEINITELVKKAGVSRTAFYRNYSKKEDIIFEIEREYIQKLASSISKIKKSDDFYNIIYNLFENIKNNPNGFRILLQAKLFNYTILKEKGVLEKIFSSTSTEEYYKLCSVDAIINCIFQKWFQSGMKEDIKYMTDLCVKFAKCIIY